MLTETTTYGFAAPLHRRTSNGGATLPAVISLSLVLSIAVVITAITMTGARAAHLF